MITLKQLDFSLAESIGYLAGETNGHHNFFIVGNLMQFGDASYILKDGNMLNTLELVLNMNPSMSRTELRITLGYFLEQVLPTFKNWGDNEKDYKEASQHENPMVRALVAANGQYLKELAHDSEVTLVKLAVIDRLMHEANHTMSNRNDISILDDMVADKCIDVRRSIAVFGKPEHLDILAGDSSMLVRMVVAATGEHKQRKLLINDDEALVRAALAQADYDIATLSKDKSVLVRLSVAEYASDRNLLKANLVNDEEDIVRAALAERGLYLDTLANDKSELVKMRVAEFIKYRGNLNG